MQNNTITHPARRSASGRIKRKRKNGMENRKFKSLKNANLVLSTISNGILTMHKGKDYFYFTSKIGYVPESIMTKSIKNIYVSDFENIYKQLKIALGEN
jgi:hypothetical protein